MYFEILLSFENLKSKIHFNLHYYWQSLHETFIAIHNIQKLILIANYMNHLTRLQCKLISFSNKVPGTINLINCEQQPSEASISTQGTQFTSIKTDH